MNISTLKLTVARWIKGALPVVLTDNGGTFTAGSITVTINGTAVSQTYSTSKDVTLAALAAKIQAQVADVFTCVYNATAHTITIQSLYATSFTVVYNLTGVTGTLTFTTSTTTFIWMDQDCPRPALPYLSGKITALPGIGQDYMGPPSDDVITITGNREVMVALQAYGSTGFQLLCDLKASLSKPTVQSYLRSGGLFVVEDHDVQDISALFDTVFENRASLDIRFRTSEQVTDKPGQIECVIATAELFDLDSSTITIDTITIQ